MLKQQKHYMSAPPCEPARSGSEGAGAATESGIGQTSWTQATDFGETGSRLLFLPFCHNLVLILYAPRSRLRSIVNRIAIEA